MSLASNPGFESFRIWLEPSDQAGEFVVTPSDGERFSVKIGRATELLGQGDRKRFEDQFRLLTRQIGTWLKANLNWRRAIVTAGDGALRLIIVRKNFEADDAFTDALADFEFQVANDPDLALVKFSATALPSVGDDALQSFLDPSFVLEYAGGSGT